MSDSSIEDVHNKACDEGLDGYIDPESGLFVFTKLYHLRRGYCCKSDCRHCPYNGSH